MNRKRTHHYALRFQDGLLSTVNDRLTASACVDKYKLETALACDVTLNP